jgi:uncharacterized Tic20 family protein
MNAGAYAMDDAVTNSERGGGPFVDSDATHSERTHALWTHLAGLLSVATASFPVVGLIVTIILWRSRATDSPFLDDHGREAVNFQISIAAYWVGGMVLATFVAIVTLGIAAPLIAVGGMIAPIALTILTGVGCVRGAIAANKGEYYRYPMCFRFLGEAEQKG